MPFGIDPFDTEVVGTLESALTDFAKRQNSAAPLPQKADLVRLLGRPPEFSLGQRAFPSHSLAKTFRQNPMKIAEELKGDATSQKKDFIEKVDAVAGYLNFFANVATYGSVILPEIRSNAYFTGAPRLHKILVEYSQPNTHKALHVGHLRNAVYGDAVCNILAYAGHPVVRATYPGDLGAHIAKCLFYVKEIKKNAFPETDRADWLGRMYCEADDYVKSRAGSPEEATIKTKIGEILQALQTQKGDYYDLYLKTREWSLEQMRQVYKWLGINFDIWYFESECDEPSRELVKKKAAEGFLTKSEGAIGIDLTQYNLGFAMYLKSDGNGLYLTKDLELIRRKFEDPEVERSIVVVDTRQKLHFQQLFKTAELMGYPQAAKSEHLSYETVTDEKGDAFSSRTLNGMGLSELRKVMEEKVTTQYLADYRGKWTDEEIKKTAEMVTLGALKYGFLRVDGNNIIKFVLDDWLKLDGDTGPYLQYVHARCCSILEKVGKARQDAPLRLEADIEKELVFFLGRFNEFAIAASEARRPAVVATYLYDLCKTFNRFYRDCPIKDSEEAIKNSRLVIVESVAAVLRKGLSLLGIPAPQRM